MSLGTEEDKFITRTKMLWTLSMEFTTTSSLSLALKYLITLVLSIALSEIPEAADLGPLENIKVNVYNKCIFS